MVEICSSMPPANERAEQASGGNNQAGGKGSQIQYPRSIIMRATTRDLPPGNLRFACPIGVVLGNNMMQIMQTRGRNTGTTIWEVKCNRFTFHSHPAAGIAPIRSQIAALEKQIACVPQGHGIWIAGHAAYKA